MPTVIRSVVRQREPSAGGLRAESPRPEDVVRQPALGRTQNPRQAPQAGL